MIKIISKKEYENLIQEIEMLRDELKKEERKSFFDYLMSLGK